MPSKRTYTLQVDEQGRLLLPPELSARFGLIPNSQVRMDEYGEQLHLRRSIHALARIYIEPTNICNLDCRTCMRNVWDEPPGRMEDETFQRILAGIRQVTPRPTVFFGGFGEPLSHPEILTMISQAAATGAAVELITNGILLDESMAAGLLKAGLDTLWVSIDGATPQSYDDVRLGAALPRVIENLQRWRSLRAQAYWSTAQLGIAFVAMQRNLHELPEVIRLGTHLGASRFSISNVLAHTDELRKEILYERSQYEQGYHSASALPHVSLPRMDSTPETQAVLSRLFNNSLHVEINGTSPARAINSCPFIEKGSLSVRWDGRVSPCLPLLHTHDSYLDHHQRRSHAYSVGNILEHDLLEVWNTPSYQSLRSRLQSFDFSPCVFCNSCEHPEQNLEDCFGNVQPACGSCLWSQGLIQCP